jgi:hypothetical protein
MRSWLAVALLLSLFGCGKSVPVSTKPGLVENDIELYNTAINALRKNRFTVARLQLQTLLETYEDREVSAMAKYAYSETFM